MAQRVDAEMDGMAGGLTNTICRDGQSTTIGRIPFAQGIGVETGTSGSPSINVIGDPDTGIEFPAAGDTGSLVAGGVEALTWTAKDLLAFGTPLLPIGVIFPFAGATAPPRTLLCFGQAVSRTTYAALFAVIGTTYGVGDSSTTFNVPDLRGRSIFGKDDMGGTASGRLTAAASGVAGNVLSAVGGSQSVQPHQHLLPIGFDASGTIYGACTSDANRFPYYGATTINGVTRLSRGGGTFDIANTTIGTTDAAIQSPTSGVGSGNIPPAIVLNYVIIAGPTTS